MLDSRDMEVSVTGFALSHAAPGGDPPESCLVMLVRHWQWCNFSEGPRLLKINPPRIERIERIDRETVKRTGCRSGAGCSVIDLMTLPSPTVAVDLAQRPSGPGTDPDS